MIDDNSRRGYPPDSQTGNSDLRDAADVDHQAVFIERLERRDIWSIVSQLAIDVVLDYRNTIPFRDSYQSPPRRRIHGYTGRVLKARHDINQLRAALRKNVLEYVQVNSVWADRNAEVSRTRTAKHAECAGIGRILESDFLSWPDQYLANQIQRLLAAVCYEHLIGRNAHSRKRKLCGDIFL